MNIWTHAIGFILVIILCLCLANTYHIVDVQEVRTKLTDRLNDKFESVYRELKEFDEALNQRLAEGQLLIKDGVADFNEGVNRGFTALADELQTLREKNYTDFYVRLRELPGKLKLYFTEEVSNLSSSALTHLKNLPTLNELWDSQGKFSDIFNYTDVRDNILHKIDSEQFDWIDLLHYLNVTETDTTNTFVNKHHISRWPILVFLITAGLCLFFSSTYHLVYVISPKVNRQFRRLDYAGVCLLIAGSTFPLYYYGFYCNSQLATVYLAIIGLFCLIVFFVSLQDFIHTPEYLTCKSWMYACLGTGAAIPMIHLAFKEHWHAEAIAIRQSTGSFTDFAIDTYSTSSSVIYYVLMGVSYLGGLYIYTKRCPEKYKPGHFDICGASHQIWHVSIIIAIVLTYIGGIINFYTRIENQCPA